MWNEFWPEAEEHKCPSCGATVLLDEKNRGSAHAEPLCHFWKSVMAEAVQQGKAHLHGKHNISYPKDGGRS